MPALPKLFGPEVLVTAVSSRSAHLAEPEKNARQVGPG